MHPDPGLALLLSPAELARADRFRRPEDRARSITGAALLRAYAYWISGGAAGRVSGEAAGRISGEHPERVPVRRRCAGCGGTDHGRPQIDGAQVSLSHSGDWVLLATAAVPVGVDVECGPVTAELAPQLLARGEPATDLSRTWVRKEAAAKLTGQGLLHPLAGIRLSERPGGWSAEVAGRRYAGSDLRLPVPAAVAIDAPDCQVSLHPVAETRDLLLRSPTA